MIELQYAKQEFLQSNRNYVPGRISALDTCPLSATVTILEDSKSQLKAAERSNSNIFLFVDAENAGAVVYAEGSKPA